MKQFLPNKKGSALIITIMIVMIITIVMIYLIEKIVPASRNVKGIENSNIAYYNGETAQEQALLFLRSSLPGTESGVTKPASQLRGFNMQITASGNIVPALGEGNSDFDKNWNIIGPGDPIQIAIGNGIDWSKIGFYFRVPNIQPGSTVTLSGGVTYPVINWALSGSGKTLFASGTQIMASSTEIYDSTSSGVLSPSLHTRVGADLDDIGGTLLEFYTGSNVFSGATGLGDNGTICSGYNCILKLSIVNDLVSTNNQLIPYLEYRIDMGTNPALPLQYAIIKTDGYSYGFKKTIKTEKQQTTSNVVWDFTVFQ